MTKDLSIDIVNDIVHQRIAPLIAVDGGRIEVVGVDDEEGIVAVRFGGSYRGSPCQGVVLKYVVEPLLKEKISELESVVMVD
jgi:Fe-S cluster biogenesis protein NfuA